MRKRVVVTGIGVVSPIGTGKEVFWDALTSGRSGVRTILSFDPASFPTRIAGEVRDFSPRAYMDARRARRMARFSQFAVACAKMALGDAGVTPDRLKRLPPKILLGISGTDIAVVEEQSRSLLLKGLERVSPFSSFISLPNAAAGEIATELALEGTNLTVSTGCASGLDAVGAAFDCIRNGAEQMVLAGGTDSPVTPLMLASLCAAGIMSRCNEDPEGASRPFDRDRDGGVLSEGAAVLILEELLSARERGGRVYGEILGYGQSVEGKEEPQGSGLHRAILRGMEDANLALRDIDYVSAHAPSDPLLDRCETRVLKTVFGSRAQTVPVSSIKGHIGNPYSAAGVFQIASVLMGMREQVLPPTINYRSPDPECDLDCVPNTARHNRIEHALVNSHGFGGANSAMILRRFA